MIDLHAHLLPGVDDGAQTLDEALMLAQCAANDGIRVLALTPHVHPGRYNNDRPSLQARFEAFRAAIEGAGIPLEIRLAGEVRLGFEALSLLLEERIPFLGTVDGYRVMLLEFPHQGIPVGTEQFIEKMLKLRVRPLIAHPERNKSVMQDPLRLGTFLDAGCWLQLTAGSLAGRFGQPAQKTAEYILRQGWAQVIATDAHNLDHRPPLLAEGARAAAVIVGEKRAKAMVSDFPAQILGLA